MHAAVPDAHHRPTPSARGLARHARCSSGLLTRHPDSLIVLAAPVHPDAKDRITPSWSRACSRTLKDELRLHRRRHLAGLRRPGPHGLRRDRRVRPGRHARHPDAQERQARHRDPRPAQPPARPLTPGAQPRRRQGRAHRREVETTLGMKINTPIPSSIDVATATNPGRPIVLAQPDHPVSRRSAAGRNLAVEPLTPSAPEPRRRASDGAGLVGRRRRGDGSLTSSLQRSRCPQRAVTRPGCRERAAEPGSPPCPAPGAGQPAAAPPPTRAAEQHAGTSGSAQRRRRPPGASRRDALATPSSAPRTRSRTSRRIVHTSCWSAARPEAVRRRHDAGRARAAGPQRAARRAGAAGPPLILGRPGPHLPGDRRRHPRLRPARALLRDPDLSEVMVNGPTTSGSSAAAS